MKEDEKPQVVVLKKGDLTAEEAQAEADKMPKEEGNYPQTSDIRHTLVGNKIVDHSDVLVVGASPIVAAPTTSSFSTEHLASIDCAKTTARRDEKHLSIRFGAAYN